MGARQNLALYSTILLLQKTKTKNCTAYKALQGLVKRRKKGIARRTQFLTQHHSQQDPA